MKTKSKHNRLAAVFLALAMLLTSISFGMFASAEDAAGGSGDGVHVFESKNLTVFGAGDKQDGDSEKAGTDNFFTLYYSAKTKIDGSDKSFDDGYVASPRVNFGGKADISTPKNVISFTTSGAATVKVWWAQGGDDSRQVVIYDKNGVEVAATSGTWTKNSAYISSLEIPDAGTYFLGGKENNNYFFKVEVTEQLPKDYVFESKNLTVFGAGDKQDGDSEKAGTDNFFTLYYSAKTKIDGSDKSFDDGYVASPRVNFGGKADISTPKNVISFTTSGAATVKVWWVQGGDDSRQVVIYDNAGEEVAATSGTWTKNDPYISTLEVPAAGTYFLGGKENNNYFFKVQVIDGGGAPVEREEWDNVEAPVITSAAQTEKTDNIVVKINAVVGVKGGDAVKVTMLDEDGNEVTKQSLAEKDSHELTFTATASGKYTFEARLVREEEEDKVASEKATVDFVLTLKTPEITSATSMGADSNGKGAITLVWSAVPEATSYNIYCDGEMVGNSKTTEYTVSDLEIRKEKYSFKVSAVRGNEEGELSKPVEATATSDKKNVWSKVIYGVSVNTTDGSNGTSGDINEDGKVTVFSEGGKGKIVGGGADGVTFYYTAVPNSQNFTLRAKMHVDKWAWSNGQEAMGMMVTDSVPEMGTNPYWTNVYYLTLGTVAYNWDDGKLNYNGQGTKYNMRLGLGVYPKLGITPENWDKIGSDNTITKVVDPNVQYALETSAGQMGLDTGIYNIAGNVDPEKTYPHNTLAEITDFIIEIQRNNTGYFFTYYAEDGETVIGKQKFYDTEALSHLDKDNVYVGFFAARNARATFSDIEFSTIDPKDDAPAEERPVEKVPVIVNVTSAGVANSNDYTLMATANVNGLAKIVVNGSTVAVGETVTAGELFSKDIRINDGGNRVSLIFTPDRNQDLGEYKVLESTDPVTVNLNVIYDTFYANQKNLYVSPTGTSKGNGSPENPIDIYTAVSLVKAGQTIVLMEGTYNLTSPVRIERGIDGTADEPIRMIADPEASSRPVFDFNKACEGIRLGGNYWYMSGFDVTNSADKTAGFRVCGNNNIIDQIITHHNGNSGLQISAFRDSSDPKELWPSNNLILNCTAYNNADNGYEDADGFAAKLTCGDGNVFDGCVSHHNADDGWDLYARASSGSIGTVTIRNCVAYSNGILLDGTDAGNGNGFKLGGENLPGGHILENCVAFYNKADGITSNSCPDVKVINCTSYSNGHEAEKGGANLNLYTNTKSNTTAFEVKGLISNGGKNANSVKKNETDKSVLDGSESKDVSVDVFVSTEFAPKDTVVGIDRREDGTIDLGDFLKLIDPSAGADLDKEGGSTSSDIPDTIVPDTDLPEEDSHEKPSVPDPAPDDQGGSSGGSSTPSKPSDPETPDGIVEFKHDGTNIEVTAPSNAFDNPGEIKFNVDPIVEETNDHQFTFDLNFTDKDGNKVQPKVAVTVRIPVPEALKDKKIYVYHVENDGKYTEISCKVEDGMVVFTASSFSKYIITSEKLAAPDSGDNNNPSTGVAMPAMGIAVLGAALTVLITKRKRG